MIVTTTPSVDGYQIADYHGIVVGEAVLGANVFRDLFAHVTDTISLAGAPAPMNESWARRDRWRWMRCKITWRRLAPMRLWASI